MLFTIYLLTFSLAAVVCFASLSRVRRLEAGDVRRGLSALVLTAGGWAGAHVGYLAAPTQQLQYAFFIIGLVIGLGAIGPWLYFCSAYTGRTLHRLQSLRVAAISVYLVIVLVKITNPLHQHYFTTETATSPFPYLVIHHQPLHWIVMGLAYILAFVGIFMLFERFLQVSYDTTPLLGVLALTGIPVVFDIFGAATPYLLDITYSPVGVAAFAVGFLYLYLDQFQTVRALGETTQPVIFLDTHDRIRDSNQAARTLFPSLAGATEKQLTEIVPDVAEALTTQDSMLTREFRGETRHFSVTANPFTAGQTELGRLLILNDVSERIEYQQELERQNERLEQFAGMVSHDLRNPLNVAQLRVEQAQQECDSDALPPAGDALERMDSLIDDVLILAREGQPIEDTRTVRLSSIASQCWEMVEAPDATLRVKEDLEFQADPDRLQRVFENLFRNAVEHAGHDVTIEVGALEQETAGFYVADDGPGISPDKREQVFESGYTTNTDGTGFGLAIVTEIVDAHGWSITVTDGWNGGARFEISGVT